MFRLIDHHCFVHHPRSCSMGDAQDVTHMGPLFWCRPPWKHKAQKKLPLVIVHEDAWSCTAAHIRWLIEPGAWIPLVYERLLCDPPPSLKGVWTHDKDYISLWRHKHPSIPITWIPNAMTTIPPIHRKLGTLPQQRSGRVCAIWSYKHTHLPGHHQRHLLYHDPNFLAQVDVYGSITGTTLKDKTQILKHYQYCVVVENQRTPGYFSEKLLDCFLTGCIPLYWGDPHVTAYFNPRGFYTWQTPEELYTLLNTVCTRTTAFSSDHHLEAIRDNFLRTVNRYCSEVCWWRSRACVV